MGRAVSIDSSDVVVTWLPLYHDMGLIGCWHTPLVFGVPAVVMSPLAFLAHPASWLAAISANGGTISVGPTSPTRRASTGWATTAPPRRPLDVARRDSGSEPVSAGTVDRFCERFAARGFRRDAFCPAYGLAEMGVGVCFTPLGRGPRVDSMTVSPCKRPVGPVRSGLTRRARSPSSAAGGPWPGTTCASSTPLAPSWRSGAKARSSAAARRPRAAITTTRRDGDAVA